MDSRAAREVCRALSESRAIAIWVGFIVFGHVAGFALLAGNLTLTLVAGALAFGCFAGLCAHVEPDPPRGPDGEVAKLSEAAFDRLVQSVEREAAILAAGGAQARGATTPALDEDGFARLVSDALDDLPAFLRDELDSHVAVVISDDGCSHGAYGLYMGGTVAYRNWGDRIVIFRDTLLRDFGSDPDTLRRKVTMVVRHELAHHLGAGELHVAQLGLSDVTGPRAARPCAAALHTRWHSREPPAHPAAGRAPARAVTRVTWHASDDGTRDRPSFRRRFAATAHRHIAHVHLRALLAECAPILPICRPGWSRRRRSPATGCTRRRCPMGRSPACWPPASRSKPRCSSASCSPARSSAALACSTASFAGATSPTPTCGALGCGAYGSPAAG